MGQKVLHWSRLVSRFTLSRTPANQSVHPVITGRCHVHPSLAFEWVNYTLTTIHGNIRKKFSSIPVKYWLPDTVPSPIIQPCKSKTNPNAPPPHRMQPFKGWSRSSPRQNCWLCWRGWPTNNPLAYWKKKVYSCQNGKNQLESIP